jgi:hypothetical protein
VALSDCYMLKDFQTLDNETILNVYFYQDLLLASIAQNVAESWIADVLPKVIAMQSNTLTHERVEVVNLDDPSNFYEVATGDTGVGTTAALPSHDAINYSLRLNSRALRPGSKRYAGLSEDATVGNFFTAAPFLVAAETLRVQQYTILLSGILETFQPIVVKRVKYNPDPGDLTHFAYRLPENDAEFVFGNVVNALTNTRVSHQVSRNNGR